MNFKLKNIKNEILNFQLQDPEVIDFLNDEKNYSLNIVKQINSHSFYRKLKLAPCSTVLDFGANIGLFSLYVSTGHNRVISFEPSPINFEILKKLTSNFNNIIPTNEALAVSDGTQEFYLDDQNSTMNSLVNKVHRIEPHFQPGGGGYFEQKIHDSLLVNTISLASIFDKYLLNNVEFVKIDIEGGEIALHDDKFWIESDGRIDQLWIEAHHIPNMHRDDNLQLIKEKLTKYAYEFMEVEADSILATRKKSIKIFHKKSIINNLFDIN
jgi:FkbM family methyltransferase